MKLSTVLVGGGVIATHYQKGLEKSETLRLDALVDINPNCPARDCFSVPFFTDLQSALSLRPRVALLALPVAAHDEIAHELLANGVDVITEKPMFESAEDIESFFDYAEKCGVSLSCMFHWKAADEVRFLRENLARFGKVRAVSTTVCDDYAATPDGTIRADRLGLMGAWIDSGINVLSFYDEIIDLTNTILRQEELLPDSKSGLLKYVRKVFDADGVQAEIVVDWRSPSRQKTSRIECEHGTLFVDHTAQTVRLGDEVIFSRPVEDRLSSHYENLFSRLSPEALKDTQVGTLLLHKILYTGNAR
ncbi:MAG: Gfo/Idh/MocA family oxidoreductase [Clostridiales bacterium]|nr:Gfo/Idh/MocA family oxidoreductase [Clostridiales bacterium]